MTRRLLAPLAGIALAGALVAGCAPAPGTAATVNGDVIGEREVAAVVDELSWVTDVTPAQAVAQLIVAPELLDVASGAGLGVSADDAAERLDLLAAEAGLEPVEVSDATLLVVQSILASSTLQAADNAADLVDEVNERVAALDVEVSPRYGTWEGGAIAASQWDWIQSAAEPA